MNNTTYFHDKSCGHPKGGVAAKMPVRDFPSMGCREKGELLQSMWQEYHVRPGLSVSVFDAFSDEDFSFHYRKENSFVDFGFFLEGDFVNDMRDTPIGSLKVNNRAGTGGIGFFRHMSGTVSIPAGKKTRIVHMHVLPDVLFSMLDEDAGCAPSCLRRTLEQKGAADFSVQRRLSPKVQAAANELFFGVRNNFGVRLYMEGKALELLGLTLADGDCPMQRSAHSLCPRERDVIHVIRKELEDRFTSPPTLAELAENHHMGVHKIQAGFKELYGVSVFGFIKEYKLQKAKMYFEEGDMNVSEVAWAIGYTNLSHFSTAYRKRFGVLPKAYLKSIRATTYNHMARVS
ncbi:AraC family transcriptional regulator [uncultured Pseudodesulfovibrio sp.]|uniref:helix-turn-helix domain-containing protein n=1 Tax=uncultured Pseudodesulfovibrio sp. TaxID=2035858 RepID=UPI0029C6E2F1|nr:AraC family transcriptional regulator [uncultured Pseudodesulfovibrio sp.]